MGTMLPPSAELTIKEYFFQRQFVVCVFLVTNVSPSQMPSSGWFTLAMSSVGNLFILLNCFDLI